jgi:dTDP-4-dehydrorhamnose reductase
MKLRVLITGAGGMLGVDLWKELDRKYELFGIDVARCSLFVARRFTCVDITDKKSVSRVINKINPDVVIHTAAWTDVDGCELDPKKAYRINCEGTKNVAQASKICGATLIYVSTDFVFDGKKKKPYKETDKPHPISIYGDSKLKGEKAVRKTLKKYFILRTSWLYGKHGKNFVDTILAQARKKKVLRVVDNQVGSPTYTKDLAKAIRLLLNKLFTSYELRVTSYGTYHVSNSGSASWYDYSREILRLAKSPAKVIPISSEGLDRPARRPAMSVLDNSKFEKFTGFKMRNWKPALKCYLAKER